MRKKILKSIFVFSFALMVCGLMAQPLPPEDGHGGVVDSPPGGGAPIGSGIFILMGLGALYGGKKVYDLKKKKLLD